MKLNMAIADIPFLIISEKSTDRSEVLKLSLANTQVKIIDLNASITPDYEKCAEFGINYDQRLVQCIYGRSLTPCEIGCANSHNLAREFVSKTPFGGVVLEDDARIPNPGAVSDLVVCFLKQNMGRAAVLSLAGVFPEPLSKDRILVKPTKFRYQRVYGEPPLAVAYALTPLAAEYLLRSNSPINFMSDWPVSSNKYYVAAPAGAYHGDSATKSIIDDHAHGRNIPDQRSVRLICSNLLRHARPKYCSISILLHVKIVLFRPILWRINLLVNRAKKW